MEFAQRAALPLEQKIKLSKQRIKEWYAHHNGNVCISYSGGKDSDVLLHLVRSIYPDVLAIYMDTGVELPEIRAHVKSAENVITVRPKLKFHQVIKKYGYPVASKDVATKVEQALNTSSAELREKRMGEGIKGIPQKWRFLLDAPFKISAKCCYFLKHSGLNSYCKREGLLPYIGTRAQESTQRRSQYNKVGCNSYDAVRPLSMPMAFWSQIDVWGYIVAHDIPYCEAYKMGYIRTGCMFCLFGIDRESNPNRFQLLHHHHPKLWNYALTTLGYKEVLDFLKVPYHFTGGIHKFNPGGFKHSPVIL